MSERDWNCNGNSDIGDGYIEYEIMNDDNSVRNYKRDGSGCGCNTAIGIISIIVISLVIMN